MEKTPGRHLAPIPTGRGQSHFAQQNLSNVGVSHIDFDALEMVFGCGRVFVGLEGVELLHVSQVVDAIPLDRMEDFAGTLGHLETTL